MKAEENAYAFLFDHYFFNRWHIVSHINSQVNQGDGEQGG